MVKALVKGLFAAFKTWKLLLKLLTSLQVDPSQLTRYIEIEKEIQTLENKNVLKDYDVRHKAAIDVEETVKSVEITLKQLELQT